MTCAPLTKKCAVATESNMGNCLSSLLTCVTSKIGRCLTGRNSCLLDDSSIVKFAVVVVLSSVTDIDEMLDITMVSLLSSSQILCRAA